MLELTIKRRKEYIDLEDREVAMQRYWHACQTGDKSAKLISLKEEEVSQLAVERIERQEGWLKKNGFEVPPPLYAPGTPVLPLGKENFRLKRQAVENMPLFGQAAGAICEKIKEEERTDIYVPLGKVAMKPDGHLWVDGQVLDIERSGFLQLAQLGGFGIGSRYLADCCRPELRSINVNANLEGKERDICFRTRLGWQGHRQIFATVTPKYAAVDSDCVLETVEGYLADAHTELYYDGNGIKGTALWMPDHIVDLAAGDIFKGGVRIETDDRGRGRIRISAVVWRNRCLNLIVIGKGEVETVSVVLRGDPKRILDVVEKGVFEARNKIGDFLAAWGYARQVKVDPLETFRGWVVDKKLQLKGVRSDADRDSVVDALLRSWRHEPGDTLADAVNAVTCAAHENVNWDLQIREELERQAARLVYVRR